MKKGTLSMKKFRTLLAATALALTMTACSSTITLTIDDDGLFRDTENGITYDAAPLCYEPQTVGEEYASFRVGSMEVILYEIEGLDPAKWLTEAYTGSGSLFVSTDITLPDLVEFSPDTIHLCVQNTSVWEFATVTDPTVIDEVVRAYTEGEAVPYPAATPDADLRFKFSSAAYPGIYYNLIYVDYGDARYLYERSSGRCVEVGDLLRDYIDGTVITEDETTAETAEPTV